MKSLAPKIKKDEGALAFTLAYMISAAFISQI